MARIPSFVPAETDTQKLALINGKPRLNIVNMVAHAKASIANTFVSLPFALLTDNTLDPFLRELAIIRTGVFCGLEYEVHQHKRFAKHIGMLPEKIDAISVGSGAAIFSEIEQLVLRFTEEMVGLGKTSDATFQSLAAQLSHAELVELAIAIGCYTMVSQVLINLEVDIETHRK